MSHADQVLTEALEHGTAQARPDMEATWRQVSRRIAAARLRNRILRTAAASVAGLAIVTAAVPSLRAAAGGFWTDVLSLTQGNSAYTAVTTSGPSPLLPQGASMQAPTITTGGSQTVTLAPVQSETTVAPAGQLPALTGLPLPVRAPTPLPQASVSVTTVVNAKDGALQGMQMVRMAWGDTVVEQHTSLTRRSADAAWSPSDAPRQTILPIAPGGAAPEERKLTDSVSAMRTAANGRVSYYFSAGGTDFTVSGPVVQEEQLLDMAKSLVR